MAADMANKQEVGHDNRLSDLQTQIDELLAEMSECREDERSAQNQTVQIIATAGTILTLIYGANLIPKEIIPQQMLFHLSNLVFCAAVGFITALGISNVLRYHYIQNIEDRLYCLVSNSLVEEEPIIHWMSFSAPVTTRNPKNLRKSYTWMHYFCYGVATICPLLFCAILIILQYISLGSYTILDKLSIGLLVFFFSFCLIAFFCTSFNARKIFDFAKAKAKEKLKERQETNEKENDNEKEKEKGEYTSILKTICYYIYPKKKDLQKPLLIAVGYISGIFLFNDMRPFKTALKEFAVIFIVIDFLLYQARYQWNDIRGLPEDRDAGKKDRLPKLKGDKNDRKSLIISIIIMIIKMFLAFFAIILCDGEMAFPLGICSVLIIVIAFGYEYAREKEKNRLIFFLVSLGYPLRFLVGLWSAHPKIFEEIFDFWPFSIITLSGLLLAYGLWGLSKVGNHIILS